MQRRPDRAGPDSELPAHDIDARDVRDVNATLELLPNRLEQHLARGGDSPAEHDPVDTDQHHHIAHADPQVTARVAQPFLRAQVAAPRGRNRLLDTRLPTCAGYGAGSRE